MYDIVFLSYYEPHAEKHWQLFKERFPRALRVSGVTGLVAAHQAAARLCHTQWFWVVDADNIVADDFDFSFMWDGPYPPKDAVSVWRATNSANGLSYGYGGIKLLPRRKVLSMSPDTIDFTTSISDNFYPHPEVASTTIIDASAYDAWKGGFREAAKLASVAIDRHDEQETAKWLDHWCSAATGVYADDILVGARAGRLYGETHRGNPEMLAKLNDFNWLREQFAERSGQTSAVPILCGLEEMYPDKPFIVSLRETVLEFPDARWTDALSRGQIQSKKWLVDTLCDVLNEMPVISTAPDEPVISNPNRYLDTVYICASWYGILGEMIMDELGDHVGTMRGLDIDVQAVIVANRLMTHWDKLGPFKTVARDIYDLTYADDQLIHHHDGEDVTEILTPTLVINTSCEHLENFKQWYDKIPSGVMVIMQSNDFFSHEEHINCVASLSDFAIATPMSTELYGGDRNMGKYTRFMRIGIK